MKATLDIQQHDAPFRLVQMVASVSKNELIEIEIFGDEICPNRIVPVVGLADAFLAKGYDIRFKMLPNSIAGKALAGFNYRTLEVTDDIHSPFGRVWRFDNARQQGNLVNAMVLELNQTVNLAKGVKQCFEWCLNEVTDNVLNHSQVHGSASGYVMVQYIRSENRLKVCVFDSGIGLKDSFAGSTYSPGNAEEAIRLAVRKGVTNGRGQGNGLWGLHEMVKLSKHGKLHIRSAGAEYLFNPSESVESSRSSWELPGFAGTTTVDFQMVCSVSTTLQDIFGADYVSVDLWQEAHEQEDGSLVIKVSEIAEGFGSRESARKIRYLVENAIENDRKFVVLDFAGVESCSSSFIDELVVRLVFKYGVLTYMSVLKFLNLAGLPQGLANFSAAQRLEACASGIVNSES